MRYESGRESFENYMKRFLEEFDSQKQYVIFGSARKAKIVREKIANVLCYVDNDERKWGTQLEGLEIKNPEILKTMPHVKIIVASTQFLAIFEQLKSYGISESNYCDFREMLMIAEYMQEQRICVPEAYFVNGNRCTLSCKGCIEYIPYIERKRDFLLEEITESLDDFFGCVDYCENIWFSGGETLLHRQLGEMIKHAYEKYVATGKAKKICITTNATIVPPKEVSLMLKRYNVEVYMSDYHETIGERCRVDELVELFEREGVFYHVERHFGRLDEGKWYDMGSPFRCNNMSEEELKQHYQKCTATCWSVWNSKFFICNPVRVNIMSLGNQGSVHDYVDLKRDSKSKFLMYYLGYNDKGYFDFCNRCNGVGTLLNKADIRAGEQV